jgi:hypothetical protein
MMSDAVRGLDVDGHIAFVTEVSRAESFDDLPVWVQEVILGVSLLVGVSGDHRTRGSRTAPKEWSAGADPRVRIPGSVH